MITSHLSFEFESEHRRVHHTLFFRFARDYYNILYCRYELPKNNKKYKKENVKVNKIGTRRVPINCPLLSHKSRADW